MSTRNRETATLGWCCADCLMWLANGETDPSWTEQERGDFFERLSQVTGDVEVTLGMLASEHADDCDNVSADRTSTLGAECDCDQQSFSWSPCDTCGLNLGGSRDAVTFWTE